MKNLNIIEKYCDVAKSCDDAGRAFLWVLFAVSRGCEVRGFRPLALDHFRAARLSYDNHSHWDYFCQLWDKHCDGENVDFFQIVRSIYNNYDENYYYLWSYEMEALELLSDYSRDDLALDVVCDKQGGAWVEFNLSEIKDFDLFFDKLLMGLNFDFDDESVKKDIYLNYYSHLFEKAFYCK